VWYPLRNEGPVFIDVLALAFFGVDFPIYVEIVRLPSEIPLDYCQVASSPGRVVGVVRGAFGCGAWESVRGGEVHLDGVVPRGGLYALQLVFLHAALYERPLTPLIDCVRVRRATGDVEVNVKGRSWSAVKNLFRD
jgi:hypothetical protein